jgi:hypothetical protein
MKTDVKIDSSWNSNFANIIFIVINIVVLSKTESKYYLLVLIQIDNRRYFNDFSIKTTRQFSQMLVVLLSKLYFS